RVLPDVDVDQLAVDLVELPGEDLQALGDLEAGDDVDDRRQDAGRLARPRLARRRGRLEDAAQARRLAGQDRHGLAVAADGAAVDPGLAELDGDVVDEVANLEVVRAVEDDVGVLAQLEDVGAIDVGDDRLDVD